MESVASPLPSLEEALSKANAMLAQQGSDYTVVTTNESIQPKEPIFLQLKYADQTTRNIGITHLVQLVGDNWDTAPAETIARTTDQVVKAILDRISLFFDAQARNLYTNENGTIFDFNKTKINIFEDKTFSVNDVGVTFLGKPLPLTRIKSESILEFRQVESGHIELFDPIDQRVGKGIFINTNGEIYRA